MITAVHDALQRQQFLRAAQAWGYFRAVLGVRLALYAEQPATGWAFYTGARGVCAALAVHGETAFACGAWEAEELGAFLIFLGVRALVTPGGTQPFEAEQAEQTARVEQTAQTACGAGAAAPSAIPSDVPAAASSAAPLQYRPVLPGYIPGQALSLYTLAPGARLPVPEVQAEYALARDPPMQAVTALLWGSGSEADAFYAEACAARNRGWAEYRLASIAGEAVSTVGAAAIFGGEAYMAAGQTAPLWRKKGIAGHMIVQLANELSTRGLCVSLLCEPELCRFYERLGFLRGAPYIQWHAAQGREKR